MSRLKKLNIITTYSKSAVEDHGTTENQGPSTSEIQVSQSSSQEFQPMKKQVANKKETNQRLTTEVNEYEKLRQLTIQENNKKLQERGITNFANSMTSLAQSQKMKKRRAKQNTHAGEDSEEDYQQVARSVASKKQSHPKYISPMSMNRVANLRNSRRVIAPNVHQKVPSISNATKSTMSEIVEGNKGGAETRMALVDEDDEVFQDEEFDDMNGTIDTNHQHDIHMADRDSVQEQLQGSEKEKVAGALKKGRGHTFKADLWKMDSTERICITFDKFGQPVGDEGRELGQYLGTLVRMSENVSIEYSDWRKVPMQKKEDMYSLVKTSLKAIANDSTSTHGDQDDFANDDYSKVKGPEKRGYVRLIGRIPAKKSSGDHSQIIQQLQGATHTINKLQSAFNVLMNVIQDHIPNANLSTVLSNLNVQVPHIGSSNEESSRNTEHEERVINM